MSDVTERRKVSFGEGHDLTPIDRFGVWLSTRQMRRLIPPSGGAVTLADIGCGYDARFGMSMRTVVDSLILVDLSLNDALAAEPGVRCLVGQLPEVLAGIPDASVDVVVLNSVLEHLDDPIGCLRELRRVRAPGGVVFVNVPTWAGKAALECSAFRLRLSPPGEIEDHRRYYSRTQLWQSMRDAGFLPSSLRVRYHKLGLNVYATVRER